MRDMADLHVQSETGYRPDVRPTDRGASSKLSQILLAPLHPSYSNVEATQSRLDAFADAAQLRLYALESGCFPLEHPLAQVLLCSTFGEFFLKYGWPDSAERAASAAFRACPELRGEA